MPASRSTQPSDWRRHFIGVASIVLGSIAFAGWLGWGFSDASSAWTLGSFAKVAFVLAIMWLAWPQLLIIKDMPGGGVAMASIFIILAVLIARPRLLLYLIPILLGVTILFVVINWLQRIIPPPK